MSQGETFSMEWKSELTWTDWWANGKRKAMIILKGLIWAAAKMGIIFHWEFRFIDFLVDQLSDHVSAKLYPEQRKRSEAHSLQLWRVSWYGTELSKLSVWATQENVKYTERSGGAFRQPHIKLIRNQFLPIQFHSEFFYMNTANHAQTPRVSTRVTYREGYHRKWAAFPVLSRQVKPSTGYCGHKVGITSDSVPQFFSCLCFDCHPYSL